MIPFVITIKGKRQIIMAKSSIEAAMKAQRLLESKRMLTIPVRLRPMSLTNARKLLRGG